jgi:cytochrome P450
MTKLPTTINYNSVKFQRDPYPIYKDLRKKHPVYWDSKQRSYIALSYDAVKKALINKNFSADCPFRASRTLFGRTIMDVDGEEHTRLSFWLIPYLCQK